MKNEISFPQKQKVNIFRIRHFHIYNLLYMLCPPKKLYVYEKIETTLEQHMIMNRISLHITSGAWQFPIHFTENSI